MVVDILSGVKANENDEWILIDDNGELVLMPIQKVVEILNAIEEIPEEYQEKINI